MEFHLPLDFLDIIVKGMLIGIICSAPMGPVGILCVQRTLNKGRWYGFVTGIGATVSDLIYALIAGLGMRYAAQYLDDAENRFYLQIFGSLLLLGFGIYCFFTDPRKKIHKSKNKKGTLANNLITAFIVTVSNPLIILLLIALYAQFAFVLPSEPVQQSLGYISICAGALLWWWGLTWLIDKVRTKFSDSSILIINRVIGSIVIVVSIAIFIGTAFNLYSFY